MAALRSRLFCGEQSLLRIVYLSEATAMVANFF
jgi:hypothetical protein